MTDQLPQKKHLSTEKLELLLEGALSGDELLEALNHLEICDECYGRLPEQSASEIIDKLLGDDDDQMPENTIVFTTNKKPRKDKWITRIKNFLFRKSAFIIPEAEGY